MAGIAPAIFLFGYFSLGYLPLRGMRFEYHA